MERGGNCELRTLYKAAALPCLTVSTGLLLRCIKLTLAAVNRWRERPVVVDRILDGLGTLCQILYLQGKDSGQKITIAASE